MGPTAEHAAGLQRWRRSDRPNAPITGTVTEVVPTGKKCERHGSGWVLGSEAPAFHVHLTDASTGVGYWVGVALPGFSTHLDVGETVTAEVRLVGGDIIPPTWSSSSRARAG